ncbi:MAG: DUF3502 domain-containing protein [Fusicatenibacter sp.]|nr:hypothetical protein [Fusicatenibacter sp.]
MKRKIICLFLTGMITASVLLTGCSGGSSASGEDAEGRTAISYTGYWCNADYEDGSYCEKMIEDALNLDITVVKAETTDTIDLLLASDEMPDCVWLDKSPGWMYEQELVRTIPRDMVKQYCPKLLELYDEYPLMYEKTLNPENKDEFRYLTGVTFQFVDYYLPCDFYRYDWIENLGLDLGVEVEQVDDRIYVASDGIELSKFREVMDAFVNQDPDGNGKNDTIGATGPNLAVGQFFSAFGFHEKVNEVNGRAEQCYVMDEYKEYLKGFAELYGDGLIDPEIITGDRTVSWDKVNSNIAGYWITSTNALNSWAVDRPPLTLLSGNPDAKILVTPGIKPDGGTVQGITNESPSYGSFYVSAKVDDEKLARILEFLEYTLFGGGDKDVHASLFYGEEGVDWEWNEDKSAPVKINTLASGDKGTWTFGQFGQDRDVSKWTGEEDLFMTGSKYWCANDYGIWMQYAKTPYKMDLANVTDYEKIEQEISSDLDAYVSNYRTQAILGQIDVDATWEEYMAELDRLGYNRMMDELEKVEPLEDIIAAYEK